MAKQNKKSDCFLSFAEVAEIIGLDETTIRNGICGTDELLRIKLGTRTLFSFNDVQAWIQRRVIAACSQQQSEKTNKAQLLNNSRFTREMVLQLLK